MTTGPRRVRVWVPEVWDVVQLTVDPQQSFASIKAAALDQAVGARARPDRYQLKYRGALMTEEHRTVADADLPDNAPLIVLPANRRPVR